jgi:hypothetical protein
MKMIVALLVGGLISTSAHAAMVSCDVQIPGQMVRQLDTQLHNRPIATRTYQKRSIDVRSAMDYEVKILGNKAVLCTSLLLRGEIVRGDYDKVLRFIRSSVIDHIDLISRGGDLTEAIKIGNLLREYLVETEAPMFADSIRGGWFLGNGVNEERICRGPDCICASACFFIWASGVKRSGTAVGLHRPSFQDDYMGTASAAERQYMEAEKMARDYLKRMEVPSRYIDLMMRVKSSDIVFLSVLQERGENIEDVVGYPPSIDEWLNTRCISVTPQEFKQPGIKMSNEYIDAENCRASELFFSRIGQKMLHHKN